MPSPIGHALAGAAIAWGLRYERWLLLCAVAAITPDIDLLWGTHRTWTHSLGATIGVAAIAYVIARARRLPAAALALTIAVAFGSHLFLDWLGRDSRPPRGVMLFWPLSTAYYVSGLDIFTEISRRYWLPEQFIVGNLKSIAREILILGPVAFLAWRWRRGP
jgi:membrane-bound metal-dependent hydrolase YbcI (DUF457 family)